MIFAAFTDPHGHVLETLRLHFVEAIDVFLLATILYVIAGGFYQLTVGRHVRVAPWLKVDSVHDLEVMLIGVVITLLGVTGSRRRHVVGRAIRPAAVRRHDCPDYRRPGLFPQDAPATDMNEIERRLPWILAGLGILPPLGRRRHTSSPRCRRVRSRS